MNSLESEMKNLMQEEDKILKKDIQTESKFEYLFEYNPL